MDWLYSIVLFVGLGYIGIRIDKSRNEERENFQCKIDRIWNHINGMTKEEESMDGWGQVEWDEYHSKLEQYDQVPEFFGYVNDNLERAKKDLEAHYELLRLLGASKSFRGGVYHYIEGDLRQALMRVDEDALRKVVDTYWHVVVESVIRDGIPESGDTWPRKDDMKASELASNIFITARGDGLRKERERDEGFSKLLREIHSVQE